MFCFVWFGLVTIRVYLSSNPSSDFSIFHSSYPHISTKMFQHSTSHTPPHLISVLPGASSLLRVRWNFSETRPCIPLLYVCWGLIPVAICCLVGGPVFERSQVSRLIETSGPPTGLPSSTASSSFPLIQPQGSAASVSWLGENIYIWFFQLLVRSSGRQSLEATLNTP